MLFVHLIQLKKNRLTQIEWDRSVEMTFEDVADADKVPAFFSCVYVNSPNWAREHKDTYVFVVYVRMPMYSFAYFPVYIFYLSLCRTKNIEFAHWLLMFPLNMVIMEW